MVRANTIGSRDTRTQNCSTDTEFGSLSLARNLITGSQHQSETSGATHEFRYLKATPDRVAMYDTLILQMVVSVFQDAAFQFINTNAVSSYGNRHKSMLEVSKDALGFIAGTGLDIMLKFYHLDLDPDRLRETFYGKFKIRH